MPVLPPSTNHAYQGPAIAAWFLTFFGLATIGPGLIHVFAPDGGAGVIAGLDLSSNETLVVSLFAWAGTTQIVWGLMLLLVSVRYRSLVPPALLLLTVERALHVFNMWGPKSSGGHHPPEAWASLVAVPVLAGIFALSLWRRR